jgi:soluble lytic murein transglycosylase-like protein
LKWLTDSNDDLRGRLNSPNDDDHLRYRMYFLQTIFYESKRAGVDANIALALTDEISRFNGLYIAKNGARGYLGVLPVWCNKIGDGNIEKLFNPQTNFRYGLTLLSHYINKNANISIALDMYLEFASGVSDSSKRDVMVNRILNSKWLSMGAE